jgi:transcription elongation factor SPT5
MLALKTCQDHRVGAETHRSMTSKVVAALKPSHAENEDAHAALKRTFEELKAELLDDMNDEEDEGEDEEDEGENAGGGGGGGGGAAGREPPGESPVERVAAGL